jgi:hypothetical protein
MKHVPPPIGEPLSDESLAVTEQQAEALRALARLRREAAAEVERLLAFLDETDGDPDLEDEHDGREPDVDGEPDLGSFDRTIDQEKSWRQSKSGLLAGIDYELDDCDREDDDPAEVSDVSGIGDQDGLLEQVGGHHSFLGRVIG